MTENQEQHDQPAVVAPGAVEDKVAGILKQMQQQLLFMEKKIDLLSNKIDALSQAAVQPVAAPAFVRSEKRADFRPHGGHGGPSHERSPFPARPYRDDKPRSFSNDRHGHGGGKPFGAGKKFGGGKPFGGGKRSFGGGGGKPFKFGHKKHK